MMTLDALRGQVVEGEALAVLKRMPSRSVNCIVTSPPYYGLRNYGADGQIGLEDSPAAYVQRLVEIFREAYRVLRDDGTLWLNLGDSYARGTVGRKDAASGKVSTGSAREGRATGLHSNNAQLKGLGGFRASGQAKNLLGIPWRVAFGLQDDGWILRTEIIWSKPACMPESVKDRPTRSHEYIFMFAKARHYYFDMESFREPAVKGDAGKVRGSIGSPSQHSARRKQDEAGLSRYTGFNERWEAKPQADKRNRRTVWEVPTVPTKHEHFAAFPPALIAPIIQAACPAGGVVLDPFMGSGTTGMVARTYGADFVGIEINPAYAELARQRIAATAPGLPLLGCLEDAS